jgi:hypothetical protein
VRLPCVGPSTSRTGKINRMLQSQVSPLTAGEFPSVRYRENLCAVDEAATSFPYTQTFFNSEG